MAQRVRKAVLPVAGLGTRFLPATKAMAKEMLTVVDRPLIQYAVEECLAAGIEEFVFVTGRNKSAIEDHFDHAYELEMTLAQRGNKQAELKQTEQATIKPGNAIFTRQQKPLGLGHAVWCARHWIGREPFAVLLPDELMGDSGLLTQMIDVCERSDGSVVGLTKVPRDKVSAYGVIDPSGPLGDDGVVPVQSMVEKPPVDEAPSDLIIIGRYVLTNDVLDLIDQLGPGAGGEIQLTDALRQQAASGPFHGVVTRTTRFDTGNPFGWLTAVIDYALARPELGERLDAWMRERLARGETT